MVQIPKRYTVLCENIMIGATEPQHHILERSVLVWIFENFRFKIFPTDETDISIFPVKFSHYHTIHNVFSKGETDNTTAICPKWGLPSHITQRRHGRRHCSLDRTKQEHRDVRQENDGCRYRERRGSCCCGAVWEGIPGGEYCSRIAVLNDYGRHTPTGIRGGRGFTGIGWVVRGPLWGLLLAAGRNSPWIDSIVVVT